MQIKLIIILACLLGVAGLSFIWLKYHPVALDKSTDVCIFKS